MGTFRACSDTLSGLLVFRVDIFGPVNRYGDKKTDVVLLEHLFHIAVKEHKDRRMNSHRKALKKSHCYSIYISVICKMSRADSVQCTVVLHLV